MKLSVIIPTIGRDSLEDTILTCQMADEILVIGDGPQPNAKKICNQYPRVTYLETPPTRNFGHSQRNHGMQIAIGTHLSFMDDDDVYTFLAIQLIQKEIEKYPHNPIIFKMQYPNQFCLWMDPEVRMGNVGTPMIVVPNDKTKLGVWGNRYEGDWDFYSSIKWVPRDIVWNTEIIAFLGHNV